MKSGKPAQVSFGFEEIIKGQIPPDLSLSRKVVDESLDSINHLSNRSSTNLETMRRVIVLGDSQVGKTSIVKRVVVSYFLPYLNIGRAVQQGV